MNAPSTTLRVRLGLEDGQVLAHHGSVGDRRIPAHGLPARRPSPTEGISVIIPVLNDWVGLRTALTALASQTRPPDELVIVDGGSTDGTRELAEQWHDPRFAVTLVSADGNNIGRARNRGIEAASQPWIACTDAGCRPTPGWLEAIDSARPEADFVAGVVVIEGDTSFQRALRHTHYPECDELSDAPAWVRASHRLFGRRYDPDRVGGGYMAFRKSVWDTVGGFPEDLEASEDHGFSAAALRSGFQIVRVPAAAVAWEPPATWIGNAAMFHRYARGDVRISGRSRHLLRLSAWSAGTVAAARGDRSYRALAAAGAIAYVALPLQRAQHAGLRAREWWRIPLLVALKDLAQLAGAAHGLADALRASERTDDLQ